MTTCKIGYGLNTITQECIKWSLNWYLVIGLITLMVLILYIVLRFNPEVRKTEGKRNG